MKNMPLSIFVVVAGFLCINSGAQEPSIETSSAVLIDNQAAGACAQKRSLVASIDISEEEAAELDRLAELHRQLGKPELSKNDILHMLSQMRARNTSEYMAREKKREELTAVYNDMQKYQGLCSQPTHLLKHLLHNDYDSLTQELWNKAYHCHMARKSFRDHQRISRQEEKLHAEVLLTPEYNVMKQGKLIIDLPDPE